MLTPYKILQLEQKQKKKIASHLHKQRSFSVRYAKNGDHTSQCFIQNDIFASHQTQQTINVNHQSGQFQRKGSVTDKKYEIVFRECIRKANAERIKVYHPKDMKRIQKSGGLRAKSEQRSFSNSRNLKESPKKQSKMEQNRRRIDSEQGDELGRLSVGKYGMMVRRSGEQIDHNQFVPEMFVQKCKININQNQNNQKMNKTIRSLFLHNKKMNHMQRKDSYESIFTEKDLLERSLPQSRTLNFNWFDNEQFSIQREDINRNSKMFSKIDVKFQPKIKSKNNYSRYQISGGASQTIDCKNIANFIKSKLKRRIPISILQRQKRNKDDDGLKRTVTDDFRRYCRRESVSREMDDCLDKRWRRNERIRLNQMEENISGWQLLPCEIMNMNNQNQLKSP